MRTAVLRPQQYQPMPVMTEDLPRQKVISDTKQYATEIEFLKQYVYDLRNGRSVENISPSNDSYYLVPENIEDIIEGMEEIAQGKCIEIDPDNLWENIN
jgi:valyl-tRNA synthetase